MRFQFTLRRLMLAVTLFAVSFSIFSLYFSFRHPVYITSAFMIALSVAAIALLATWKDVWDVVHVAYVLILAILGRWHRGLAPHFYPKQSLLGHRFPLLSLAVLLFCRFYRLSCRNRLAMFHYQTP